MQTSLWNASSMMAVDLVFREDNSVVWFENDKIVINLR